MPEAVFRFDASPVLGYGHAMRCSTLAAELRRHDWRTVAVVNDEAVKSPLRWQDGFARVLALGVYPEGKVGALRALLPKGCDLLVVDHYAWSAEAEGECRGWARRVLAFEDVVWRAHETDVLLCPSLGVGEHEFADLVPRGCVVLAGGPYVQMSSAIVALRDSAMRRRAVQGPVQRILVSMGGGSISGGIDGILAAAQRAVPDAAIDLVLTGGGAPSGAGRTKVHVDTPKLPELTAEADLAIGAAGVSALERCCLGLPSIVFVTADNQKRQAAALDREGLAVVLGCFDDLNADALETAVRVLAGECEQRCRLSEQGMACIDGRGAERVASAIGQII